MCLYLNKRHRGSTDLEHRWHLFQKHRVGDGGNEKEANVVRKEEERMWTEELEREQREGNRKIAEEEQERMLKTVMRERSAR